MEKLPLKLASGMAEAAYTGPTLYPWDSGVAVAELQEILNAHGFRLRADGDFGHITEAAVKAYQRQKSLRVDGVVGAKTWLILKSTVKPGSRILRHGHTGYDVWELQGLLQISGYSLDKQGIFDDPTHHSVLSFQQRQHLHDTGLVDDITWTLLRGDVPLPPRPKRTGWRLEVRKWW